MLLYLFLSIFASLPYPPYLDKFLFTKVWATHLVRWWATVIKRSTVGPSQNLKSPGCLVVKINLQGLQEKIKSSYKYANSKSSLTNLQHNQQFLLFWCNIAETCLTQSGSWTFRIWPMHKQQASNSKECIMKTSIQICIYFTLFLFL